MQKDEYGKYYTPTEHQRREYYFIEKGKLSHTYCPVCLELQRLSEEGLIEVMEQTKLEEQSLGGEK